MTEVDRVSIRRTVRRLVRNGVRDRDKLVNEVAAEEDVPTGTVRNELDDLERNGFVYMVGDAPAEVKLP
jgi:predicted ArsR family transcriptional regulator